MMNPNSFAGFAELLFQGLTTTTPASVAAFAASGVVLNSSATPSPSKSAADAPVAKAKQTVNVATAKFILRDRRRITRSDCELMLSKRLRCGQDGTAVETLLLSRRLPRLGLRKVVDLGKANARRAADS